MDGREAYSGPVAEASDYFAGGLVSASAFEANAAS